jgi:tetratricopeptide (TPR) repeat protein
MQTGHWLKVRLRSWNRNHQPIGFGDGTKVIAHLGAVPLRRTVSSVAYLSQSSHTLHFGLGAATRVDQLEVRWHAGETNFFDSLDANATYELTEGEAKPKKVVTDPKGHTAQNVPPESRNDGVLKASQPLNTPALQHPNPPAADDKARLIEFWNKQHAAMNAMKIEKDIPKAIALFREALALNPNHEDSRYYLGLCLARQDDGDGALAQLDELKRINPQSHRAFQQWGVLRAMFARTPADLEAAEASLERARALNPEETGALLVLGEISLLRGLPVKADERLAAACRTNPKAVGGFFLRAYLAWKREDNAAAAHLLEQTRNALGKDCQPKGATSEGDVKQKQHVETTPLTRFWESWDGSTEPARAFAKLDEHLNARAGR